ncbi:hypothetical protein N657DRAFT_50069 [Parathielavia appendiculata]|uniref:Uncharacterized protein n=1 Tax=Parathielavia appendiculata TaxID=2587402 RepID=A0AAN6U9U0_9PEZI|nr:hypothetical protein N657DRAFT_50069 [Parathielavia appendiculata]
MLNLVSDVKIATTHCHVSCATRNASEMFSFQVWLNTAVAWFGRYSTVSVRRQTTTPCRTTQPSDRAIVGVPAWPVGGAVSWLGRPSATVCGLRMALSTVPSPGLRFTLEQAKPRGR